MLDRRWEDDTLFMIFEEDFRFTRPPAAAAGSSSAAFGAAPASSSSSRWTAAAAELAAAAGSSSAAVGAAAVAEEPPLLQPVEMPHGDKDRVSSRLRDSETLLGELAAPSDESILR